MITAITILNLFSFLFLITSLVVALIKSKTNLNKPLIIAAAFLLLVVSIVHFLEYSGITTRFDPVEDILKALFLPVFIFIIYTSLILSALTSKKRKLTQEREDQVKVINEMEMMLNSTEESFVLVSPEFRIIASNKKFQAMCLLVFGEKVQKGDPILDYAQSERKELVVGIFQRVLRGELVQDEVNLQKDDFPLTYLVKYKPVYSSKNDVSGIFISTVDITNQKKYEEKLSSSEKRFKALVENSGDGILVVSPKGNLTYVSPSTRKILGYSETEFTLLAIFELIHPEDQNPVKNLFKKANKRPGESISSTPIRVRHMDNSYRFLSASFTNLTNDPVINGIVVNYRDVSKQILSEREIKQSKDELQKIMDQSIDMICSQDENGIFLKVSAASKKILGYYPVEMIGKKNDEFVHDKDKEKTSRITEKIRNGKEITNFENRCRRKDGTFVTLIWSAKWDNHENILYSIARDATEINKAKEKIKESERRLKKAQSTAKVGNWDWDIINDRVVWSDQVHEIYEINKNDFGGSYDFLKDFIHPEDKNVFTEKLQMILDGEESMDLEARIITPGGKTKYIHVKGNQEKNHQGQPAWLRGTVQDITDRKNAELEKQQFLGLLEKSLSEIYLINAETLKFEYANEEALHNIGYSMTELSNMTPLDIKTKFNESTFKELIAPLFNNEKDKIIFESVHKRSDGKQYPVEVHLSLTRNLKGHHMLMAVALDISERKNKENELKTSNERFKLAMKAANEALWEWDILNETLYWSEGYEKIFKRSPKEDSNPEMWRKNIYKHDKEAVLQSLEACLNDPSAEVWQHDYRYVKGDEKPAWVEARGFIVRNNEGSPTKMIGSMIDITEKKTFQERLMESVIQTQEHERNRVAKDLHDGIVQELVACGMKAELIRLTKEEDERNKGLSILLQQIKRVTNNTRNLSHGLLSADINTTDLPGLIERLAFQLNSISSVEFFLTDKLKEPYKIREEVKINLYRAIQEITSNIIKHSRAENAHICLEQTDGKIHVSIKDDGVGIKNNFKKGTGIGIYNIENRIKKIGGSIEFISPENGGLETHIYVTL